MRMPLPGRRAQCGPAPRAPAPATRKRWTQVRIYHGAPDLLHHIALRASKLYSPPHVSREGGMGAIAAKLRQHQGSTDHFVEPVPGFLLIPQGEEMCRKMQEPVIIDGEPVELLPSDGNRRT